MTPVALKPALPFPPRLPAEWEPQRAVHIAWPVNTADWPGKYAPVPWAVCEIIRHIAEDEEVFLAAATERHAETARRCLRRAEANLSNVQITVFPLDRGWMRDISPLWVHGPGGESAAVRFSFNGWAKYDNHRLDAQWPPFMARKRGHRLVGARWNGKAVFMEGGALDPNGAGALLVTEECLLDPVTQRRNPGFSRQDYEALFAEWLGISQVIWLGKGIAGDDTHGHVDDICRFVNPRTVVLCREPSGGDANHAPLEENRERLQGVRLGDGRALEVVELPMPAPVVFDGMRLPASYANFLITNAKVLVPTFNDANDRKALGILAECFPGREVVGIHAVDLVWGLGTVHCLTHEEPAAPPRA
ncbi:MAG TPA: agmatine deiminase family protein [Candidatus Hydrogenedentes bacterium]|nr:agmatine deiminase family protein [Candidatus Hydrogenedentota bacterium]